MRILQVHKFFYPHAGSETAMFHTRELLRSRGHEVIDFAMHDDRNEPSEYASSFAPYRNYTDGDRPKHRRAIDAAMSVYSPLAGRRIRRLAERTRPDVAHFHIVYHQLTMAVVRAVSQLGIPCVFTVHDYKIGCPAHVAYRDGAPCELCSDGSVTDLVRYRCIKGSRPASMIGAAEARLNRAIGAFDAIDMFIAPSQFAADLVGRTGVSPERIRVVPNFLPDAESSSPVAAIDPSSRFFYAGRLEEEKGVGDLLRAYAEPDPTLGTLVVAGAGGELSDDVAAAAASNPQIEYLGRLSREEVRAELRRSRALLVPSRWNENNPMSVLEARASGIPVISTTMGGLPEMVTHDVDGLLVDPFAPEQIRLAVRRLSADRNLCERLGRAGFVRLRVDNSEAQHLKDLSAVYDAAIAIRQSRSSRRTAVSATSTGD